MRIVLLDAGPLGFAVNPHNSEFDAWLRRLQVVGVSVFIPEIADYEVRRELVRAKLTSSVARLDALREMYDYEPITTWILHRAAELWAETRNRGRPLADPHALDADVILAATSEAVAARGHDVVIATTNLAHLATVAKAEIWHQVGR